MTGLKALIGLVWLLSMTLADSASAQGACRIERKAQVPLTESFGRFTAPVTINGQTVPMLVDTGAQRGFLSPEAADRLKLPVDETQSVHAYGVGGQGADQHPRIARSITLGGATWRLYRLMTTSVVRPEQAADPNAPVGLIGADMLAAFDVELDFPARTMTLYAVSGCSGRFLPWTGPYDSFAKPPGAGLFVIPVQLEGHPLKALVDTGANISNITQAAAVAVGADAQALERGGADFYIGGQGDTVAGRRQGFYRFSFGSAAFRRLQLSVLDASFGAFDMLLGIDFLRTRRMWLSYGTDQLFIQSGQTGP